VSTEALVRVYFTDAASGACFAQSEVPADQLPASFEARTTVNLQGQDWEVTRAVPMTRAEYERTGELHLTLSKITIGVVPAGDLLYSLPTICDFIPGIAPGTSKLGKTVLELHEDDWRQIELVSGSQDAEINNGLTAVRAIHDEHRTPSGFFKELHIRKEVPNPLDGCRLTVATISGYFASPTPLDGIAYRDVAGLIESGFALRASSGLTLYGVETAGLVTTLGLQPYQIGSDVERDGQALAVLMRDHNLNLIDWCRAHRIHGSDAVMTYLSTWFTPPGASP
jgi:hypothetical protein